VLLNAGYLIHTSIYNYKRIKCLYREEKLLKDKMDRCQTKKHRIKLISKRRLLDEQMDSLPNVYRNSYFGWVGPKATPKPQVYNSSDALYDHNGKYQDPYFQ
jgi:hypothetical protein